MMRLKERPQISENLRGENRKNSAAGTMKLYASGHFDATISRAAKGGSLDPLACQVR